MHIFIFNIIYLDIIQFFDNMENINYRYMTEEEPKRITVEEAFKYSGDFERYY